MKSRVEFNWIHYHNSTIGYELVFPNSFDRAQFNNPQEALSAGASCGFSSGPSRVDCETSGSPYRIEG